MHTIIESHKTYSKYYNAFISILLSYSGGAQPYCTHLKIYGEDWDESQLMYGEYCSNLIEAMASFKERCIDKKVYDSKGNRYEDEGFWDGCSAKREWDDLDRLCCPKPESAIG